MSATTAVLIGAMISMLGVVMFIFTRPVSNELKERLSIDPTLVDVEPAYSGGSIDVAKLRRSLVDRLLGPLVASLGTQLSQRLPSNRIKSLRALIEMAGNPPGKTPSSVLGMQFFCFVAFFFGGIFLVWIGGFESPMNVGIPVLSAVLGFTTPKTSLERKAKKRAKEIERVLPDMIDLLTVSVEAGLTFEAAIRKVCEKFDNVLSLEFQKALNEYRLGMPLNTALKEMAERLHIPQLEVIIRVILQSEQLGTSLGTILRIQSATQRRDRRARAEELGQKAPIKMLLPMVGCIFPTIFIILLGPAVIQIFSGHS